MLSSGVLAATWGLILSKSAKLAKPAGSGGLGKLAKPACSDMLPAKPERLLLILMKWPVNRAASHIYFSSEVQSLHIV